MGYSRRLPPLLRVVGILGLLFPLAGLALWGFGFVAWWSSSQSPLDANRVDVIAGNLTVLSFACTSAVAIYRARFRQADRGPFPRSSWQRRMRVIALVAALSICMLVLALVIPPTTLAFVLVLPIFNVGALVVIVATLVATLAASRGMNTGR